MPEADRPAAPDRARTTPTVSYAQHGEDIVLQRAFIDQPTGRYVDVGAFDPTVDSVTRLFHDRGWRGVNIDPDPEAIARFQRDRPDDVNLALAVGRTEGVTTLYVTDVPGWSTTDEAAGAALASEGHVTARVKVQMRPLSAVLDEQPGEVVDFLKIDAEGSEEAVVDGIDLNRHRPRVVVLESVAPGRSEGYATPAVDRLCAAGYTVAGFDGLNVYLTCEADLVPRLAIPANPTDVYVKHGVALLESRAAELETAFSELQTTSQNQLDTVLAERDAALRALEERLREAMEERDAAQAAAARFEAQLISMLGSWSWRVSRPLRVLNGQRGRLSARTPLTAADALLHRVPRLRAAMIGFMVRHPLLADRMRKLRERAPTHRGGSGHDVARARRAAAVAALAGAARRRRTGR